MSIMIFEVPVYQVLPKGEACQILSFNPVIGTFKLANVVTGEIMVYTEPLNAEYISYNPKPSRYKILADYNAVAYVLSLGVTMLYSIPDWMADKLVSDNLALNLIVHQLQRVDRMLTETVGHDTDHGTILYNKDLQVLCTSLFLNAGEPNEMSIAQLRGRGFVARPLDKTYGWDVPVIETKRGLLTFG